MYYLARRKLGLSPGEWDDLPWHHQRLYLEGFEQEGILESSGSSASPPITEDGTEDFSALDTLMAGAKTRRAGRGKGGQG